MTFETVERHGETKYYLQSSRTLPRGAECWIAKNISSSGWIRKTRDSTNARTNQMHHHGTRTAAEAAAVAWANRLAGETPTPPPPPRERVLRRLCHRNLKHADSGVQ